MFFASPLIADTPPRCFSPPRVIATITPDTPPPMPPLYYAYDCCLIFAAYATPRRFAPIAADLLLMPLSLLLR